MASATKSIQLVCFPQRIPAPCKPKQSPSFELNGIGYLTAGLLLGFASAYLPHVPLTMGKITILVTFGISILANRLGSRKRGVKAANPCI